MQIKYTHDFTKHTRQLTLSLAADDLEGLPIPLLQAFRRAEHRQRPAELVGVWARILGLRPVDAQASLFPDAVDEDAAAIDELVPEGHGRAEP